MLCARGAAAMDPSARRKPPGDEINIDLDRLKFQAK
jgi:hypothetical protein